MSADPIPYGDYDESRNCNYWKLDPTLRFEARRIYPDDEYEWAEPVLSEFGETLGHRPADTADRIDEDGHDLRSFDRHGERPAGVRVRRSFATAIHVVGPFQ